MTAKIIKEKKIQKNNKNKKTVKGSVKKNSKQNPKRYVKPIILTQAPKIPYGVRVIRKPEEKQSKNQIKRTSKKIFLKILILLFVICLAFSTVYAYNRLINYLSSLERFFIDNIEIKGCKNVTESEIINTIPFKVGETAIGINLWQLEKDLKESKPELKTVLARRINWFGKDKKMKIVVSLTERVPEVFIYNNENKEGLDFDNKPFSLRGNMSIMKVPLLLYSKEQDREKLLNFYKNIKVYFYELIPEIKEIKYGELDDDVVITMNNGTNIYWGVPKESKIKEKAEKFFAIKKDLSNKKQNMDYIDLSFIDVNKDKIIVKISNVTEETI